MLLRNLSNHDSSGTLQSELDDGLPTIHAFARLCGRAISGETSRAEALSKQAMAILSVASDRGIFDIRGNTDGFESADRFLAVCVELDSDRRLILRDKSNPRITLGFLDGFRELCQAGLVMHHTQKEFSLTNAGFDLAATIDVEEYVQLVGFAVEVEH